MTLDELVAERVAAEQVATERVAAERAAAQRRAAYSHGQGGPALPLQHHEVDGDSDPSAADEEAKEEAQTLDELLDGRFASEDRGVL